MKRILISMYSLNIGGAERSLIGLLESINFNQYKVDLFLYRHEGEFLSLIPKEVNLLPEVAAYTTFERPIKEILSEGFIYLSFARIMAKVKEKISNRGVRIENRTYKIMQYTWKYSLIALPELEKEYDLAISFLGPHDFITKKVQAKKKVGWVHTDYAAAVSPDERLDRVMWNSLDWVVTVSEECRKSFLEVFSEYKDKTVVIENILSPNFVLQQAEANVKDEMPDNCDIKICSVGRFSILKGFDMAVKACRKLLDYGFNIRWYVVGYGGEEANIKYLIEQYGVKDYFILLGKKANPYPYIRECSIYCQPSRCEGKAVTVREAQILGKPVVITRFPTSSSQLENGIDGYICELSPVGIAEGIRELIEDASLRDKIIHNLSQRNYGNENEIDKIYHMME